LTANEKAGLLDSERGADRNPGKIAGECPVEKKSKKLSLAKESVRVLEGNTLGTAVGGFTEDCSPYPSHGPCSLNCGTGNKCY